MKKQEKVKINAERGFDCKRKIIEMVEGIKDETVLKKIYTVVKTHISILNEK